jgi:hypothetical protein
VTLKAIALRLPEELVTESKRRAAEAGTTFTSWARAALEAKLKAPSLLDQPMKPLQPTGGVPHGTIRGAPERADQCAHPFRDDQGRCRICGVRP